MIRIRAIPVSELTPALISRWSEIAQDARYFGSPFFEPAFTCAVATVRDDVAVAVIEDEGRTVGFFPFQRGPRGLMRNVCSRLSEFHAPIVESTVQIDPTELMRACGTTHWHFDHLPLKTQQLTEHIWGETDSPYMNLADGYDSYVSACKAGGSSSIANALRKSRKLAREVGPLRFTYHDNNESAFRALCEWKNAQHQRTGRLQIFEYDWVIQLLSNLTQGDASSFPGLFSTLYAGDSLVAVHLGLRSESVVHIWFPAYNVEFEKYSPGLVLLLNLAEEAASRNIQRIDFGRGTERYKANFKSGDLRIAEGAVDLRPITGPLRQNWYATKRWIRSSRWQRQFDWPFEVTRRIRQQLAFD